MCAAAKKKSERKPPPETSPQSEWEKEEVFSDAGQPSEDAISDLQAQVDALRSQLARMSAEYENFRKRSREEKEKTVLYATEALVSSLLPILGDFDRALAHAADPGTDNEDVLKGVDLIHKRCLKVLEGQGVIPFDSVGRKFDPHFHEALQTREQEGCEPGTVVQEFEKGFTFHDRLLRAAKVAVTPKNARETRKSEADMHPLPAPPRGETMRAIPGQMEFAGTQVDLKVAPPQTPEEGKEPEELLLDVELVDEKTLVGQTDAKESWAPEDIVIEDESIRDEKTNPEGLPE
ncbi:MAG: nucleotide exchange factor GrpE [Deltaproteobacteria bacterium]|nr:nucleotide exchange factor GrpE [Deltaproteobacteria bacterium]